jgi:hypothetical protein
VADPVALTSVVSSGLVALGGLFVTYRSGREQRAHEARLAYEERAWEEKSSALFRVIAQTRGLLDVIQSTDEWERQELGVRAGTTLNALDDLVPVVESYASTACRSAFDTFRQLLRDAKPDTLAKVQLEMFREKKMDAIDAQDFVEAKRLVARERAVQEQATAALRLDVDKAVRVGQELIDAARSSVRGDE